MYSPFSLENKSILITGASSGIGRAIAIECSRMGAHLHLTGRNEKRLLETLSFLDQCNHHTALTADLSSVDQIDNLVDSLEGKLDGVVQCAGFTIPKPFQFISSEDISAIMDVNYKAPVLLSQKLVRRKKSIRMPLLFSFLLYPEFMFPRLAVVCIPDLKEQLMAS